MKWYIKEKTESSIKEIKDPGVFIDLVLTTIDSTLVPVPDNNYKEISNSSLAEPAMLLERSIELIWLGNVFAVSGNCHDVMFPRDGENEPTWRENPNYHISKTVLN